METKNKICLVILLFIVSGLYSQTYNELRDSASISREHKDYDAAFRYLSRGIVIASHPYHNDLYDAASLASLLHLNDTAFFYFNHLLKENEFDMITCDANNDPEFRNLREDGRWRKMIEKVDKMKGENERRKIAAIADCIANQDRLSSYNSIFMDEMADKKYSGRQVYEMIKKHQQFPTIKQNSRELQIFATRLNDSVYSFYDVQLPKGYNPMKSYPMLLVLHGAVFQNTGFPDPQSLHEFGFYDTTGMNQFFSQLGYNNNYVVVYPHANREFNWMFPDDGFPMILHIVRDIKRILNIDDNRVSISGHSNGATGVVSYLLKAPGDFSGFYGVNSNPRIRTGGTFIKNALNRAYYNIATDKDYYFPVSGHDTLSKLATSFHIRWQNHVYRGFPHWFPQFKESYAAFNQMFIDMNGRIRNSFSQELYWECDDVKNGRCDWLKIEELDTISPKKKWQDSINFPVTHWINNRDTSKISDTVINAFDFPRLSGAVKARFVSNEFYVESSRVKKISIFLSPEMIDFTKPVRVHANGKIIFNRLMDFDKGFILASFRENADRKAIWVNAITININ